MSTQASQYLSLTWDRDRIMALAQFVPMLLDAPLSSFGSKDLHDSVTKVGALADTYRTVTRLSGLIDILAPEKIANVLTVRDPTARRLGLAEYVATTLFYPFEHLSLLNAQAILKQAKGNRFGGVAVFFWFYSLLFSSFRQVYQMLLTYPHLTPKASDAASVKRQAEWRRMVLNFVKTVSFLLFSLTCLPAKGKPQLLATASGVFLPVHRAIEILSPSHLALSTSLRGLLGSIATAVDFA